MNINLRQLRAFVSIGRLGSFTKAAAALHATQPALSAQIRELEEALGVKLFDRSTRSVTLTQAGEDLSPAWTRSSPTCRRSSRVHATSSSATRDASRWQRYR